MVFDFQGSRTRVLQPLWVLGSPDIFRSWTPKPSARHLEAPPRVTVAPRLSLRPLREPSLFGHSARSTPVNRCTCGKWEPTNRVTPVWSSCLFQVTSVGGPAHVPVPPCHPNRASSFGSPSEPPHSAELVGFARPSETRDTRVRGARPRRSRVRGARPRGSRVRVSPDGVGEHGVAPILVDLSPEPRPGAGAGATGLRRNGILGPRPELGAGDPSSTGS